MAIAATFWLAVGSALADPGPTEQAPPTISGVAQQGQTLTVDPGTWTGDPITFTYLWSDGTAGDTDVLSASDVGQPASVTVTATNDAGTQSVTVSTDGPVLPLAPVLDASGPSPTITGTAQQGDTLTVSNGNWDNDPTEFSYVWEDCDSTGTVCNPISGAASANTYTLQSTDVESTVEVVVTASNAGGGNQATSGPDGPVLPAAPVADSSGPPTISGTPQQGDTLSVTSNGTWSNGPTQFNYEWEDCNNTGTGCGPVAGGASSSTYTVQSTDVGSIIEVVVTASNAGGQNPATSNGLGPVLPAAPTPDSSGPPTISGTAQQGDKLTVTNNGTWSNSPTQFGYVWQDCDSTGTVCAPISGAASTNTYTVQSTDVGSTIEVIVTASNAGGQNSAASNGLGPVLPAAPVAGGSGPPTISGTAQQGDTLTVTSNGTWSNNPTNFAYVWQDCPTGGGSCSTINDATSSYTLQQSDVGSTVKVVVTASNAGGQNSATSNGLGPVLPAAPSNSVAPTISGTAQQGDKLTVTNNGTWSNSPTGFSYQWDDCLSGSCSAITGATSSTYTLQASDVGDTVVAVVTGSNAGGQNSATSNATQTVLPAAPTLVSGKAPVLSGTAQQGDTLSVTNGSWNNNPTTFTYAWEACNTSGTACAPISGAASANTYTVESTDVGSTIEVIVTGSNAGGANQATSNITKTVLPAAPTVTGAPGISPMTAQQGVTLTASKGTWSNSPTTFAYAWQDCSSSGNNCAAISGATASTYTLKASDVGKLVSVTVTASNAGGATPVTSASVGPVLPPAPANTVAPQIAGNPEQGVTLGVTNNGTWSNATTYAYAWEQCDSSGNNCVQIPGATSSSYTLSAADIGDTIVCVVTATGPGGSTPANSNKTATVVAAPTPAASQPTTTSLLASPASAVTNQAVTLITTVTSSSSASTALWGTVTLDDGGVAIRGCANLPVTPSGQSATVACSTSFAAAAAQLTAVFTPTSGSVLKGSLSPVDALAVGRDTTTTSLDATASVDVGSSTTFTASVSPPAARVGPVEPTGSVEFLDAGQPITSCAAQLLTAGQATCSVTYSAAGAHQITARYVGDTNFTGSSSPAESVSAAPLPTNILGTITSTMQWAFYFTPSFTQVRALVVNGTLPGATVLVKCHGKGCPFAHHATLLGKRTRCGKKTKGMCAANGSFLITPGFAKRHLSVGSRITVEIIRPNWVGKFYSFTVRSRQGPRIQIGCLTPGSSVPGQGC